MFKSVGLIALSALMLVGCGAAPTAPGASTIAPNEAPQQQEAFLADKFTGVAFYHSRDNRPYMHMTAKSITGRYMEEDTIHFSTDGKTAFVTPVIMGADHALYIKRATKEPRVYTFHKVGTYTIKKPATGEAVTFKFNGKLKATSSNLPLVSHDTITLRADALPTAATKEPTWLSLDGHKD